MPATIIQDEILNISSDALVWPTPVQPKLTKRSWFKKPLPAQLTEPPVLPGVGEVVAIDVHNLPIRKLICVDLTPFDAQKPDLSRQSLYRACLRALRLAESTGLSSVVMPLEAFNKEKYLRPEIVMTIRKAVRDFLRTSDLDVKLVVSSTKYLPFRSAFHEELDDYIGEQLCSSEEPLSEESSSEESSFEEADEVPRLRAKTFLSAEVSETPEPDLLCETECLSPTTVALPPLDDWIDQLDESFSDRLLHLIAERGKSEVEVYKKANLDRKLFSKIRSKKNYTPKKSTILALCVALELDLEETEDLLSRAGYALSHASVADIIVEYFLIHENYDLFRLNETLFYYDQPLLGG